MALMSKAAIVTGAAQGIGKAIAARLVKDGMRVAIVDINQEAAVAAAEELAGQYGADTMAVQCDVSQEEQVNTAVQKVLERFGTVDVLVNNTQEASDATNMITGAAGRADVPVVDVSEQMPKDADTLNAWINQLINTIIDAVDPSYGCEDATDGDTADSNANSDDSSAEGSATDDANAQDSKASTGSSTDPKYIRQCKAAASSDSSQDSAKADAANGDSGDASGNDQTDSGK